MAQAPIQTPTEKVGTPHVITYYCTDNFGNLIAELPFTGVKFSRVLNGAGTFSANLPVEDPRVQALNWIEATAPNLTCLWVIVNGTSVVWGGMIQQRTYTMNNQQVSIQANEFWAYLNQRVQAFDYSTTWAAMPGAGAVTMGAKIITDALNTADTLGVLFPGSTQVVVEGTVPAAYFIVASFPLSQQQQIGSLIQQLQTMGYLVGFDFATDINLVEGIPTAQLTLSYPRRGRIAGTTGLMVDTAYATDFTYPEDGTQQADKIWELATAAGGVGSVVQWAPAMTVDGYPLLESVESHMVFSALTYYTDEEVSASQPVLNAWGQDDLFLYAFPPVAPTITVPLFGRSLTLGDFEIGDDIRVVIPKLAGGGPGTCPRFPNGMDFYWRIIQMDVAVSDGGLSSMTLTLNVPLSTSPQAAPA